MSVDEKLDAGSAMPAQTHVQIHPFPGILEDFVQWSSFHGLISSWFVSFATTRMAVLLLPLLHVGNVVRHRLSRPTQQGLETALHGDGQTSFAPKPQF